MIYSKRALDSLMRLTNFLQVAGTAVAEESALAILDAVSVLERHPLIGREVDDGMRELVISRGKTGYIALYDFREVKDVVLVLAIRHQRQLTIRRSPMLKGRIDERFFEPLPDDELEKWNK